jgi:hypothetical protein
MGWSADRAWLLRCPVNIVKKSTNGRLGVDSNKLRAINCSTHESFARAGGTLVPRGCLRRKSFQDNALRAGTLTLLVRRVLAFTAIR